MPQVRKANPEKNCFLQTDKLYIDSKIFVYNEVLGQVVEHSESVRSHHISIAVKPLILFHFKFLCVF